LIDGERRGRLRDLPAAARGAAWDELWAELGRQQQASAAEARRQHLRRIVTADDRFGGDRRGALTDRGRVYVRWGEPAEVEQAADPLVPGAVWEVWTYPEAGLRFVFHDAHGLGDFRLRRTEPLWR
jgi:GWxTD domain-containing protein